MANQRILHTEEMVGHGHGTKADTLNRQMMVEHSEDGTHGDITGEAVIKGWIQFDGTGGLNINDCFNVSSIADVAVGKWTVNWDTDFANADYACVTAKTLTQYNIATRTFLVGSVDINVRNDAGAYSDDDDISVIAIGDQ